MASTTPNTATRPEGRVSMDDMPTAPAHAKPEPSRAPKDHLWVLVLIAGFALFDVWESWTQVGNKSGFTHGTGWTLTVIVEAGAGYMLFAWFGAPGPRSRKFAMRSAFALLVLSLIGQGSSVLAADAIPPLWLKVFVKCLPVIVLALIALLIEMRHRDRADAEEAERAERAADLKAQRTAAAADERTALRAELEAERAALQPLRDELETAQRDLAEALTRAETLTQKLAAVSAQKKRVKAGTRSGESDPTNELRAVMELRANPKLMQPRMSGELARALGLSAATGRRLHGKLVADGALTQYAQSLIGPLSERSPEQSDERS